jgi:hypothetical protein
MSFWETEIFQGIKPTAIHVADWRKQLKLWEAENDKAERPQDEIIWEHGEREDPETKRTIPYRIVYEYVAVTEGTETSPAKLKLLPTAVYVPVNGEDEIVYLTESPGDPVDVYRRIKERARAEKEQANGIRYRSKRVREKSDLAAKMDPAIAEAGMDEVDKKVMREMIKNEKGKT